MRDSAGDFGGRVDFSPCSQGGKGLGGRAGHGDDEQGPLFRPSATTAPAASRRRSSLKAGIVAPSVMLRKLAAYRRHNQPDLALQELGRIERTLFTLDWLESPELRRRCHAGLNKSEQRRNRNRPKHKNTESYTVLLWIMRYPFEDWLRENRPPIS